MSSDERFGAVTSVLSNIRSLRVYAREVSYEFLQEASEKLQAVIAERQDEYLAEQRQKQEEQEKLEKVKKYMESIGLDPALLSLQPENPEAKKTGKKPASEVKPKYRLTDKDGVVHEWSGRGRIKSAFKEAFENGHTKEEFLIKSSDE
ncbi:Heat-stable nucleoid-structuring protein [Buttiauxella sp. B2]|uniref:H-NS histone family protein n=1 Tax=Buttiauxella sp. B2 TaxID=2587812 RepID=UPI00111EC5DC|nr:H-NS family nucleoid-associated regulatory protein [Buttiauxella sp. B2]TNV16085.1 Heat-stable nucleoid-structuring protein [Buttiauxella sp. B2]